MSRALLFALLAASASASASAFRAQLGESFSARGRAFGAAEGPHPSMLIVWGPLGAPAAVPLEGQCTGAALPAVKGGSLTLTRSSSGTCLKSDGSRVTLSANQPRLQAGGLLVEPSSTNLLLFPNEMDQEPWTPIGTPVITVDAVGLPGGPLVGETISDDNAGGSEGVEQLIATTGTGVYTFSAMISTAGTGTESVRIFFVGTGNSSGDGGCNGISVSSSTPTLVSCQSGGYAAGLTGITVSIYPTTDTGALSVVDPQVERKAWHTSFIESTDTAATRAVERSYFAAPGASTSEGCSRLCVTPTWTGAPPTGFVALTHVASGRLAYFNAGNGNIVQAWNGGDWTTSAQASYVLGTTKCYTTRYSVSQNLFRIDSVTGTDTLSTLPQGMLGALAVVDVGSHAGAIQGHGMYRSIELGKTYSVCSNP